MSISLQPIIKLLFNDNNPGVTKLKNTVYDSVYVCECKTMLQKERHYMFVIGAVDKIPIGSNVQIEDINNISCIQFRTFQEPIVQQVLANYIEFDSNANQVVIKRYNISKDANNKKTSEYMFEYEHKPYNVHIFHGTDSDYEYVPEGNLLSALITWDTMIMSSINVGAPPQSSPQPQSGRPIESNRSLEYERRPRAQVRNGLPPRQPSPLQQPLPPPRQPSPLQQQPRLPLPPQLQSQSYAHKVQQIPPQKVQQIPRAHNNVQTELPQSKRVPINVPPKYRGEPTFNPRPASVKR